MMNIVLDVIYEIAYIAVESRIVTVELCPFLLEGIYVIAHDSDDSHVKTFTNKSFEEIHIILLRVM